MLRTADQMIDKVLAGDAPASVIERAHESEETEPDNVASAKKMVKNMGKDPDSPEGKKLIAKFARNVDKFKKESRSKTEGQMTLISKVPSRITKAVDMLLAKNDYVEVLLGINNWIEKQAAHLRAIGDPEADALDAFGDRLNMVIDQAPNL